ncbi:MAG: hypothetical protein KAI66_13595 [Lentisphaeria bacterium]|nr:hypothetical protein [Lentisphaeria bacterium]
MIFFERVCPQGMLAASLCLFAATAVHAERTRSRVWDGACLRWPEKPIQIRFTLRSAQLHGFRVATLPRADFQRAE